jgi:hypothetical protein
MSNYKYLLVDEDNSPLRKFASKIEAQPYLSQGYKLIKLPKQPSAYHTALALCGEALF